MKKYRLCDVYEGFDVLGVFSSMAEVRAACRKRDIETDGEWTPLLYEDGHMITEWTY